MKRFELKYWIYATSIASGLFLLTFLSGCSDDDPEPPVQNEVLDTYSKVLDRTQAEIEVLIAFAGLPELSVFMQYDIAVYSITYKTTYLEEEVIASGLVAFPVTDIDQPMMSFQHGTITQYSDAPTVDLNLYGLLSSVASAGYIFCVPDFIGFGSSTQILHPYYHAESTANSVVDILRAAEELSVVLGYNFNGKVFLSGYSEGGFATMATHKSMEENPVDGLELVASAPASGGYDIKGIQEYFFSLETYHQPYYLGYVALSYQQTYGFEGILTDIFQEPFATDIPDYFNGSLSGDEINEALTFVMEDLLTPDVLANIDNDNRYDYLNNAFELNSVDDWVPQNRMIMYHGTEDITVPYQNSVDTYDLMISLGASPNVLSFVPLQGATHDSGVFPYLEDVIQTFDGLK